MKKFAIRKYVSAAAITAGVVLTQSSFAAEPPRGADVESLAANCNIGPFNQTSKAGPYNALCNIMQDAEKCLALVKGQFHFNGESVMVEPVDESQLPRARYCLEVLRKDLGIIPE